MNFPKPQIDRETAMRLWIEEHSDYAKEQVILNNVGMVGSVLKSLNLNLFDEDLFEIGLVGLVKAVNTFNPNKDVKFCTYAMLIIRYEILKLLRIKQIIPEFSLDELYEFDNGEKIPCADMIADNKQFEEDVIANMLYEEIMNMFSDKEREIICLRMEEKTQQEVGKICGFSQTQISRFFQKNHRKFKKILDREG